MSVYLRLGGFVMLILSVSVLVLGKEELIGFRIVVGNGLGWIPAMMLVLFAGMGARLMLMEKMEIKEDG